MKQVVVTPEGVAVEDVPAPRPAAGQVLVRTAFSCISPGTELSGAARAAEPVWKQALRDPGGAANKAADLLGDGVKGAKQRVRARRARTRPTGYSASGVVVATGRGVADLAPGDRVACAGAGYANHAELLAVPRNLVARVPDGVPLDAAATVTIGAIALHGVRRAEPTLGETFVVVGLGAVGQLTAQLLRLSGCRVLVADLDPARAKLAISLGADGVLETTGADARHAVRLRTGGIGADGVIVTAASSSDEIVSGAFRMCRAKGRVVLVGDVGLHLRREDLYPDELELRISTSTGPGRYDPTYEEQGVDYPVGYVRWTENRNMQAVLDLLATAQLDVGPLLSGPWDLDDAVDAFAALGHDPKPVLVLLRGKGETGGTGGTGDRPPPSSVPTSAARRVGDRPLRIAVVGVGSFARAVHLPNLVARPEDFELHSVVAAHGTTAVEVQRAFGARSATTDIDDVLADPDVDAVVLATRHDRHAELALRALEAGKHVLVEKPPALDRDQVEQLRSWFAAHTDPPVLLTGFNRRFSPLARQLRAWLDGRAGPAMVDYQMNAGFVPASHWVHGPEGGGRNVGEACHIYDLFRFLLGCDPVAVTAVPLRPATGPYRADDNFVATLAFRDGSVAVLTYTAVGAPEHPKERMTVHVDGRTAVLDDYRALDLGGTSSPMSRRRQAKGHGEELAAFADAVRGRAPWPMPLNEQLGAVEVALAVDTFLPGRAAGGD
jgi:predicted dehydrogenase/threonine dehydrogenase-like Zn-dependent dehydrogenase